MTTIKDKIKKGGHTDWILCTLGLQKTNTALYEYVKDRIFEYSHSSLQSLQNPFTPVEFIHINSSTGCIRIGLLSKVKEKYDRSADTYKWEWIHRCQICRGAFQKILTLHTGESRLHLENCDDTSSIPLEWAIAKMFMPKGNKDNKEPEDTDPAALLNLLLNCHLFTNAIRKSHKVNLKDARNHLVHSSDNTVGVGDKTKYFDYMESLLRDASSDNDVDNMIRNRIVKDIEEIKKLKDSEISMTLYDDALKLKRKGIHNDFERYLSKIESEEDIEQLRKLLVLAEKAGADIQALNDELEKTKLYKEGIERIRVKLTDIRETTRDVSEKVQRDLEKFQRVELQKVVDQMTCLRETLKNEKEKHKNIIGDFNLLIVVIVIGTVFFGIDV